MNRYRCFFPKADRGLGAMGMIRQLAWPTAECERHPTRPNTPKQERADRPAFLAYLGGKKRHAPNYGQRDARQPNGRPSTSFACCRCNQRKE